MANPDTLIVDGHPYSWQRLCELRRQQLEAWRLSQPEQPALFALKADCRPQPEGADRSRLVSPDAPSHRSVGRDPRSPACDHGQFSAVAWLPGGALAFGASWHDAPQK
jgi:hypothetical protein